MFLSRQNVAEQYKKKIRVVGFFSSAGDEDMRVPPGFTANQLISAGKASDFAIDRMRLISSHDDKPVDLLEGCKNNSDKSVLTQENCVPSSNHGSANMQSQH